MTNETEQPTEEQERETIEREFPYKPLGGLNKITHASKIEEIAHSCAWGARTSTEQNSRGEAFCQRATAIVKSIGAAIIVGGLGYLTYEVPQFSVLTAPVTAYLLKKNLMGNHPVSGMGTYLSPPYFSIFDNLKLGNTWSKIAKLQREEKISQGNKEMVRTSDCYLELGRNFFGGP